MSTDSRNNAQSSGILSAKENDFGSLKDVQIKEEDITQEDLKRLQEIVETAVKEGFEPVWKAYVEMSQEYRNDLQQLAFQAREFGRWVHREFEENA